MSSNNSSWSMVTAEMFGGLHPVDEHKRAGQVRVDKDQRSTTENNPSSKRAHPRKRMGVPKEKNQKLHQVKKRSKHS